MRRCLRRLVPALGAGLVAAALGGCGSSGHASTLAARPASDTSGSGRYVRPPAQVTAPQLFLPMGEYTRYVAARLAALRPELRTLDAEIASGHLAGAEHAWLSAHLTWLEIGQDDGQYGAFASLGGEIDGLAEGDPGGAASPSFSGFHRVEYDLFHRRDLRAAEADAARLTGWVDSIGQSTLDRDLALSATSLDAWVLRTHEILEDALRDSLSQQDNYGSDSDLASVRADVSATREMLSVLSPLLEPRAPGLVQTARSQLRTVDAAISAVPAGREPSSLGLRARQRINGAVSAALETLAPVSEIMQITTANS